MKKKIFLIITILITMLILLTVAFSASKYYSEKDDNIISNYNDHTEYKIQVWQSAVYIDRYYYEDNIEDKISSNTNYKKIDDNSSLIEERINECLSEWNIEGKISTEELTSLLNEDNYYYLDDIEIDEYEYNFRLYIYNIEEKYILRIKNYS